MLSWVLYFWLVDFMISSTASNISWTLESISFKELPSKDRCYWIIVPVSSQHELRWCIRFAEWINYQIKRTNSSSFMWERVLSELMRRRRAFSVIEYSIIRVEALHPWGMFNLLMHASFIGRCGIWELFDCWCDNYQIKHSLRFLLCGC